MRSMTLCYHAPDVSPDQAFARLSDYASYPAMTDAVQAVSVDEIDADGALLSTWTVRFRSGLLRWTERDVLDPLARTIAFWQVTGDFHVFDGRWAAEEAAGQGALITFEATFDLGMATLEAILEPVAEAALRENVALIVQGLLGPVEVLAPGCVPEGAR